MNTNIEQKIKKSIARGIKYLRKYRLKVIEQEEKKGNVYDGGASILLSYLQCQYAIDFSFDITCGNLVKCAQEYSVSHHKPIFNYDIQHTDLFETNFLRDIYIQKYTKYTIKGIIQKMEQYLQSGGGIINQIMPLLGLTDQREMRYTNVGLGLVGLMQKNPEKILNNKYFIHLKKRVSRELADIVNNNNSSDNLHLNVSITKSYSLFLLNLLDESKRIDDDTHQKFIISLLKSQNSSGEWIYSDITDTINEINNAIITIFSVVNLLNYYNKTFNSDLENINYDNKYDDKEKENEIENFEEEENNKLKKNKEKKDNNDNKEEKEGMIEGFSYAGGVLTPNNIDKMLKDDKRCIGSIVEVTMLLLLVAGSVYLLLNLYKNHRVI
jgi:hypothetical protein